MLRTGKVVTETKLPKRGTSNETKDCTKPKELRRKNKFGSEEPELGPLKRPRVDIEEKNFE